MGTYYTFSQGEQEARKHLGDYFCWWSSLKGLREAYKLEKDQFEKDWSRIYKIKITELEKKGF